MLITLRHHQFINSTIMIRYVFAAVCFQPRGNPAAGIAMLPLYAANCGSLVVYDHPEYEARGWTRAERVVFAAFNMPVLDVLEPMDGTLCKNFTRQNGRKETRMLLSDATLGELTNHAADGPLIEQLQKLAIAEWGNSWRGKWSRQYYEVEEEMRGMQRLEFGTTEIRLWDAAPGSQWEA